eukprot:6476476-Amphidinium_carterae.1
MIRAEQDGVQRVKVLAEKATRELDREEYGLQPRAALSPVKPALAKLQPLEATCLAQQVAG